MTAPHIVGPAGLLGEALAEASADLVRQLVADDDRRAAVRARRRRLRRRMGQAQPRPGDAAQRLPAPRAGHPCRHDRRRRPQAPEGHLLPGMAARAPQARRGRADHRRRRLLPRRRVHPPDGQAGQNLGHRPAVQIAGVPHGHGSRRARRPVPPPPPRGCRAVHLRRRRRPDDEGPRRRPRDQRRRPRRHGCQRGRAPRSPGHARRDQRDRPGLEPVLRRPRRPRPDRRPPRHLRRPPGPGRDDRGEPARSGLAALSHPLRRT